MMLKSQLSDKLGDPFKEKDREAELRTLMFTKL